MDWSRDGADWPNRVHSRFVQAGGFEWHVQCMGQGPALLLVHGTGASSHSWRDLAPLLARRFTVIAPDLPGHAFSSGAPPSAMSLRGMAQALVALLEVLRVQPVLAVGHSAGAALLVRLALDGALPQAAGIVALNGALLPLAGWMRVMSPAAKLLAALPGVPQMVSRRAQDDVAVARLIVGTGSVIDARGHALYARLMRDPAHVAGVLSMMARWDLDGLVRELPRLAVPLWLVAAALDRTVPPAQARRVALRQPKAKLLPLPGLGHLAHEEAPEQAHGLILRAAREAGLFTHARSGVGPPPGRAGEGRPEDPAMKGRATLVQ
jgi:magnesium chelatase accessory protein